MARQIMKKVNNNAQKANPDPERLIIKTATKI